MSESALSGLQQNLHAIAGHWRTATRDLEVTLKINVRKNGDDPAAPDVAHALDVLLRNREFRSGAYDQGHVFHIDGVYVTCTFDNTFRVCGVKELVR